MLIKIKCLTDAAETGVTIGNEYVVLGFVSHSDSVNAVIVDDNGAVYVTANWLKNNACWQLVSVEDVSPAQIFP